MYALKVTCKEALDFHGKLLTEEGQEVWVIRGEWGWEGSACPINQLPNLVVFDKREDAEKVAKTWKGAPWFYTPKRVEVVEVHPLYQTITGWRLPCREVWR